jgi:GDPmannose 4,6-dehydratase
VITTKAVITGITGQDGAYLAKLLIDQGIEVFGVAQSLEQERLWRLSKVGLIDNPKLHLSAWKIDNPELVNAFVQEIRPDTLYNLASHSSVVDSAKIPYTTGMVSGVAAVNLLEAVSSHSPNTRFFQAGSSEMFGAPLSAPQDEDSYFAPRSIYGAAKLMAFWATENYKIQKELFATNGILYNHESPLRSPEFVTRKISQSVARIRQGIQNLLEIGNLSASRDWGYAPEYVSAMHLILNQEVPENFVVASGESSTVRDFVRWSFAAAEIDITFEGSGTNEKGYDQKSGALLVKVNPEFYRVDEEIPLVGNPGKLANTAGWTTEKTAQQVAQLMVESDLGIEHEPRDYKST